MARQAVPAPGTGGPPVGDHAATGGRPGGPVARGAATRATGSRPDRAPPRRPARRGAPPRPAPPRPAGPAAAPGRAGRGRRRAGAARGGPGCEGGGGRRWRGRRPGSGRRPRTARSSRPVGAPSSGCAGPGGMAATPSRPARGSRLSRTVSAWSSMVCPVATDGGQHGEPGRPGPGLEVGAVGDDDPFPAGTPAPNRCGGIGHHVGLGRRAGAQAVVDVDRGHPAAGRDGQHQQGEGVGAAGDRAAQAATRPAGRCSEEQRAVERRPGRRARAGRAERHAGRITRRGRRGADPGDPRPGSRISASEGSHSGPRHTRLKRSGPPARSTALTNVLALGVLAQLGLQPEHLLEQLGRAADLLAPLSQHPAEPLGPGDRRPRRPGPSSRRRGPRAGSSAPGCGGAPRAARAWRPAHARRRRRAGCGRPAPPRPPGAGRRAGGGGRRRTARAPWSTRETKWSRSHGTAVNWQRWVTSWRASHSRNSAGGEAVARLDGHDVRADVVHDVLVLGQLVGEEQVVLAEHPGGHPRQHQAELGAAHRPAGAGQRARQPGRAGRPRRTGRLSAGLELLQRGAEEPLDGGDVRARTQAGRSMTPGPGRGGRRSEPGGLGHQLLGLGGQLVEVGSATAPAGSRRRRAAGQRPPGHPLGQRPVDEPGAGAGGPARCSLRSGVDDHRAVDGTRGWAPRRPRCHPARPSPGGRAARRAHGGAPPRGWPRRCGCRARRAHGRGTGWR